jgi:glycosyltransferase 2 family protein
VKKAFFTFFKVFLSLSFGLFLIWYVYKDLSDQDKDQIFNSFKEANYFWIALSLFLGLMSHISRAYRWLLMLETMDYKPSFGNSFFTLMTGYIANLALPRLGEVSRCALMTKYEKIPFQNSFGTVMAERLIDLFLLLLLTLITVFSQFKLIIGFISLEMISPIEKKINDLNFTREFKVIAAGILISAMLLLWFLFKKKSNRLRRKIILLLRGFSDGFKSILKIKKPFEFILHTLFIWIMYYMMLYACYFALIETASPSLLNVLSTMVFGTFGLIAVQGGIGAYPIIVSKTLTLYGVNILTGFAFGWIIWTSQTFLTISGGLIAILLLPAYNKRKLKYAK